MRGTTSKSPPALGRLDGERHDEVGLVEVPLQPVALAHDGQVQRPEGIGVAEDLATTEDGLDQVLERVPLVEAAQR